MTSVIEAKNGLRDIAAKAKAVVEDASLTPAAKMEQLDRIQADAKAFSDVVAIDEKAKRLISGGESADDAKPAGRVAKSLGAQVTDSAGYKAMVSGATKSTGVIELKASTIDEGTVPNYSGGSGLGGQLVAPQFLPGIVPLKFQPLTIAGLFAQGTTEDSAISYVIEAAFNDNTATVAEKGAKPQLDLSLARRQDNVSKIANIAKVTDEMFKDAPQFQSYLENRMVFGVQRAEEGQLLNGNGTAPNLTGILNRSGLAAAVTTAAGLTAQKAIEGIFNQITALRSQSFVEPDAIVINPTDWQTIRLGKDAQGQYYAGGPFTGAYGNPSPSNVESLWGYRVVITSAIAQGTVLVGGFQECGQVFRREGIRVEMTNSNVDDFQNNLVTLRAEERLALAVYRPAGFGKVTLTA